MAASYPLTALAVESFFDKGLMKVGNGRAYGVARYRYTKSGERVDNVTDWAVARFRERYGAALDDREDVPAKARPGVNPGRRSRRAAPAALGGVGAQDARSPAGAKNDIFAYCYAALHDPVWRAVHADDLRREFPRVKLHHDFARWRDWGRALLQLHLGYEEVEPWPVTRVDAPNSSQERGRGPAKPVEGARLSTGPIRAEEGPLHHSPKGAGGPPSRSGEERKTPTPKLKSYPEQGLVVVDMRTQIIDIPPQAWAYRLGNRSAIDWVLDQHKEKRPRDPTVATRFDTYRFADHKEAMIVLLARVVRVSVETVAITEAMREVGKKAG